MLHSIIEHLKLHKSDYSPFQSGQNNFLLVKEFSVNIAHIGVRAALGRTVIRHNVEDFNYEVLILGAYKTIWMG